MNANAHGACKAATPNACTARALPRRKPRRSVSLTRSVPAARGIRPGRRCRRIVSLSTALVPLWPQIRGDILFRSLRASAGALDRFLPSRPATSRGPNLARHLRRTSLTSSGASARRASAGWRCQVGEVVLRGTSDGGSRGAGRVGFCGHAGPSLALRGDQVVAARSREGAFAGRSRPAGRVVLPRGCPGPGFERRGYAFRGGVGEASQLWCCRGGQGGCAEAGDTESHDCRVWIARLARRLSRDQSSRPMKRPADGLLVKTFLEDLHFMCRCRPRVHHAGWPSGARVSLPRRNGIAGEAGFGYRMHEQGAPRHRLAAADDESPTGCSGMKPGKGKWRAGSLRVSATRSAAGADRSASCDALVSQ